MLEVLSKNHCRQTQVAEFRNLLPEVKDLALALDEGHGARCIISKGLRISTYVQ